MIIHKKFLSVQTFIIISFILLIITGCGNPTVNILMKSADDSNDMNAIQIKIFQLRSSEKFKLASRESLLRNAEETLGKDLIPNSIIEKIMIPGESFYLEDLQLNDETKYIGVIGDFYQHAKNSWSQLIDISKGNDDIKITIGKNFLSVTN